MKKFRSFLERSYLASSGPDTVPRGEGVAACALLLLALALRIAFVFRYRFDSDETQHLHIVWGWAHGLLQYRDLFDNHAPLFHLLYAPVYALFGDSPDTLFDMRLAVLPLFAISLWCAYRIGRELFSPRIGLWAAAFTALYPLFFLCSAEFRTDDLWTALWLMAIAVLVNGELKAPRFFWGGFLLGAAMGASMKTSLLVTSLAAGALVTALYSSGRIFSGFRVKRFCINACAMLAGFSVVPVLLVLFFYRLEDLGPLCYGTIGHNVGLWKLHRRALIFPAAMALLFWYAPVVASHAADEGGRARRRLILFTAGIYVAALKAFWPLLETEHFLPFYPLAIVIVTPLLLDLLPHWRSDRPGPAKIRSGLRWAVPALVVFLELFVTLWLAEGAPWCDGTRVQMQLIHDVCALTKPGDYVADLKGAMVFRPRSPYYVMEIITRSRFKKGLIKDDIPERLIATHTCVVSLDPKDFFPRRARAFMKENYLTVGSLRVAGKLLSRASDNADVVSFDVRIPDRYVILAASGPAAAMLDGAACTGPRFLEAGRHEVRLPAPHGTVVLLWAKAYELGYSPFVYKQRGIFEDVTAVF